MLYGLNQGRAVQELALSGGLLEAARGAGFDLQVRGCVWCVG